MALVSLEDPGLTVFATHRLLTDLDTPAPGGPARHRCASFRRRARSPRDGSTRPPSEGIGVFGYIDAHPQAPLPRCGSRTRPSLDEALAGRSEAYRRLDAAILEELILAARSG